MATIQVLRFSTLPELAGWDTNACGSRDYDTARARALYAALGVAPSDEEYTLAAHADGRWALIGLTVTGHKYAAEAPAIRAAIETGLENGKTGDARVSLVLVDSRELYSTTEDAGMAPALATNGGPFPVCVTGNDSPLGSTSLRVACEAVGCTPSAFRAACAGVYPESAEWDWASGTKLVPWREVDCWSFRGRNAAERLERGSEEHVAALAEYRRTGGIADVYLVEPNGDVDDDSDCVGGPAVDEIDWDGFTSAVRS